MADKKISALTAASTPLAGTEVLPIVQSGATVKVAVSDLTAGRSVGVSLLTVTSADPRINYAPSGAGTGYCLTDYSSGGGSFYVGTDNSTGSALGTSAYARLIWGIGSYPIIFGVNNAEVARFNTSGNLAFPSGKGIDFSATAGTGTSELLADYEEGTWTPVIEGSTTAGTASYSLQNGRYTKVGRQVYVEVAISWSSGTGTGNLTITGLPFTSANAGTVSAMSIALADFVALTALNIMTAFVPSNTTRIEAWQYPTGGGAANNVAYDAGGALYLSGSYTV